MKKDILDQYIETGQLEAAMHIVTKRLDAADTPNDLRTKQTYLWAALEGEYDLLFDALYAEIMAIEDVANRMVLAYAQWRKIHDINKQVPIDKFKSHMRQVATRTGYDEFTRFVDKVINDWYPK